MSFRKFRGDRQQRSSKISRLPFTEEGSEQAARDLIQELKSMSPTQYMNYLSGLNQGEKTQIAQLIWSVRWIDSHNSLEEFAKYVVTRDEHAPPEHSEKPFPTRVQKPYIWEFLDTIQGDQGLHACEKSKQLMVTWAMCLYCLWVAKFQRNRIIFVQSKKELDAANLVFNTETSAARISFMETKLPEMLKNEVAWSYGKAVFDTGSWIWGIPEGGDQIRSYTVSLLFSDEFAFQPEGEQAWAAANASVKRGGKIVIVSSANASAYMKQLIDRV